MTQKRSQLELVQAWQKGDQRAGAALVRQYRGAVVKWATIGRGVAPSVLMEDFMSQGNIGVLRAATAFDPERSPAIPHVVELYVREEVMHYAHLNRSAAFSVKSSKVEKRVFMKAKRWTDEAMDQGMDRDAAVAHVAARLKVTPKHVEEALALRTMGLSYAPLHNADDEEAEDVATSDDVSAEDALDAKKIQGLLADAFVLAQMLTGMNDRQCEAVRARMQEDPVTYQAMADASGHSRENSRLKYKEGIRKLQSIAFIAGIQGLAPA